MTISYYEKIGDEIRCIDSKLPFDLPDSWIFVRLKHIGEIVGGGTPKTNITEYWDGNIPWLTPADFRGYEDMYVSAGARAITEIGLKFSSAQILPANSVLYSSRAPIGYIAIAANPISTNQGFKSVVPYDFAMSPYLYYSLKARTDDIVQRATGTTFKEISGSEMAETIIPLPPIKEQKRVFEKVSQLFEIITAIEKSLN
ncbi:restriction endonuclease subunit S [Agathobaculum massiliense]|uniref:restriction endonuclease subunit S n=1 Tax=Agathobaculum massiliense TaxID=3014267 RepID=UPI000D1F6404|nr:restriction endonuclease subunit S [Agathobaculum massiliense]